MKFSMKSMVVIYLGVVLSLFGAVWAANSAINASLSAVGSYMDYTDATTPTQFNLNSAPVGVSVYQGDQTDGDYLQTVSGVNVYQHPDVNVQ